MPRFCRALCGPRVTVSPQVISGPASPGQHVCTGSRARSTAVPSHTISWHGARPQLLRRHVHHLQEHGPRVLPRVLQAFRRLRFLEEREELADVAQRGDGLLAHPQRHALRRAEQIAEDRDPRAPARTGEAFRSLEQQRGAAGLQHAIADLGHLEPGVDFGADALQLAAALELGEKVAEVGVLHRDASVAWNGAGARAWYQTRAGRGRAATMTAWPRSP